MINLLEGIKFKIKLPEEKLLLFLLAVAILVAGYFIVTLITEGFDVTSYTCPAGQELLPKTIGGVSTYICQATSKLAPTCGTGNLKTGTDGGTTCTACPANSSPNTAGTACVCNPGFPNIGTATAINCLVCPANSTLSGTTCECDSTSIKTGGTVTAPICQKCPTSSVKSTTNTCVCPKDYKNTGTAAVPNCVQCTNGSITSSDGKSCICPVYSNDGKYMIKNTGTIDSPNCVSCNDYTEPSSTSNASCICRAGYRDTGTKNSSGDPICAKCPSNSYPSGSSCICNTNYVNDGGTTESPICYMCRNNSSKLGLKCVCNSTYVPLLPTGVNNTSIVPQCTNPPNSNYDNSGTRFVCSTSFINKGTADVLNCDCPDNMYKYTEGSTSRCICKSGYKNTGTFNEPICTQCSGNSTTNSPSKFTDTYGSGAANICVCPTTHKNTGTASTAFKTTRGLKDKLVHANVNASRKSANASSGARGMKANSIASPKGPSCTTRSCATRVKSRT